MTGKPFAAQGVRTGNTAAFMAQRDPEADEVDFFPTAPWGGRAVGELIRRFDPEATEVWECACGPGLMAHGLADYFPRVLTSDAYVYGPHAVFDFLSDGPGPFGPVQWIVTNPPFAPSAEFVRQALKRATRGVAMLVRAAFSETVGRYPLLNGRQPVAVKAWFAERLPILKGRWEPGRSSASAYVWMIWLKAAVTSPVAELARLARRTEGMALDWTIPPGTKRRLSRDSDLQFAARA